MARYLQVILPVLMIVLGLEVLLNFVLDMYRPRRSGEYSRPAADSRVLGLLAAPDRIAESIGEAINYQLGTDVTSNWFYRLLSRRLGLLLGIAILTGWLMTSFTVVAPHQRAVMLRFGKVVSEDIGPGLHLKFPWPIDRVAVPEFVERNERGQVARIVRTATGVRTIHLGSAPPARSNEPILWTTEHVQEETFQIVQAGETVEGEQDFALVALEVPVHYVVSDPLLYQQLAPADQRDQLLRAIGQRTITRYLSRLTMDEVLGTSRQDIADALRGEIESAFASLNPGPDGHPRGAGIRVIFVGAHGAHPPRQAARAFENVIIAQQNAARELEDARRFEIERLISVVGSIERARDIVVEIDALDAMRASGTQEAQALQRARIVRLLEEAGGEAATLLARASMHRWERHLEARGRASRYDGQLLAYRAHPGIYKSILYFDALRDIMRDARVTIVSAGVPIELTLDLKDATTAGQNVFQGYEDFDN